ncbi:MAG: hypothetical protein WCO00_07335 [Rhodospirillaceae bacterium]
MSEPQKKGETPEEEKAEPGVAEEQQKALIERLTIVKGDSRNAGLPFGGALIKIDNTYYEPSLLRISSFAINPYEGQLIAGQMLQCSILLPDEKEPFEISVAGAVKTVDESFGLRAIFSSPQLYSQQRLAQHLIEQRKAAEAANLDPKKKKR